MRQLVLRAVLTTSLLFVADLAAAQQYDKKFRDDFMQSCIKEGATYTVCQCAMLQIEAQIKLEEFIKMRDDVQAGKPADKGVLDRYDKIFDECVEREKQ